MTVDPSLGCKLCAHLMNKKGMVIIPPSVKTYKSMDLTEDFAPENSVFLTFEAGSVRGGGNSLKFFVEISLFK